MANWQILIMILVVAAGTMLTRFSSFIIFRQGRPVPGFVAYLGKVLPQAVMGLLVVYCLRNVQVITFPHGLPELIAIAVLYVVHRWKKNTLLSIFSGTAVYMFLVQAIF